MVNRTFPKEANFYVCFTVLWKCVREEQLKSGQFLPMPGIKLDYPYYGNDFWEKLRRKLR